MRSPKFSKSCRKNRIGEKGMFVAAKALADSALDLFTKTNLIKQARADFEQRKAGYDFVSLIPAGQKAPLKIK